MKILQLSAIIGSTIAMSACSDGLTQMQDTIAKFDQGAHSAATAQTSFFQAVQTAECNQKFYTTAFNFATARKDKKGHFPAVQFDATGGTCVPTELTNDELTTRQKLMTTITLYADAIQTLANGTDDKNLSTNSQNLVTSINNLAKQQKITVSPDASIAVAALNAAVVTITQMIFDHEKYKDIKGAATSVQAAIHTVVDALKAENLADATGLSSKVDALGNDYQSALLAARDEWGAATFIDAVQVRLTFQSIEISPPNITQLNNTLDALAAANDALARADNGGAIPEISDLIGRARQASTLFNAVK